MSVVSRRSRMFLSSLEVVDRWELFLWGRSRGDSKEEKGCLMKVLRLG